MNERWFMMFDGTSPDGRGDARYIGRTKDPAVAWAHFKKCRADPYSTGYVLMADDRMLGRDYEHWMSRAAQETRPCCDVNASYPGKHRGGCASETRSEPTVEGALKELRQRLGVETSHGRQCCGCMGDEAYKHSECFCRCHTANNQG